MTAGFFDGPGSRPDRADVASSTLQRDLLPIATFAAVVISILTCGVILKALAGVLVPLSFAVLLGYLLRPVVDYLQTRLRFPRALAVVATFALAAAALLLLIGLITTSIGGLDDKAVFYKERVVELAKQADGWLQGLGISFDSDDLAAELEKLPIGDIVQQAVGTALDTVSNTILALLFTIYLVSDGEPGRRAGGIWTTVERTVRSYVATKFVTSAGTAILFWGVLAAFGVDLAVVFGVLAFLLNFIPSIGSLIAVLLPIPIALVGASNAASVAAMVAVLIVIQNVIGNWLEPKMMGRGLDLHPVTILVALGVWGWLWGVVGMLLAAPLTAIVRCILAGHRPTWALSELLAGRIVATSDPAPTT